MKRPTVVRPGQVYLDTKGWNIATVYAVVGRAVRAVVTKTDRQKIRAGGRAFWAVSWKNGVPEHYAIQYDPPERKEDAKQNSNEN